MITWVTLVTCSLVHVLHHISVILCLMLTDVASSASQSHSVRITLHGKSVMFWGAFYVEGLIQNASPGMQDQKCIFKVMMESSLQQKKKKRLQTAWFEKI